MDENLTTGPGALLDHRAKSLDKIGMRWKKDENINVWRSTKRLIFMAMDRVPGAGCETFPLKAPPLMFQIPRFSRTDLS